MFENFLTKCVKCSNWLYYGGLQSIVLERLANFHISASWSNLRKKLKIQQQIYFRNEGSQIQFFIGLKQVGGHKLLLRVECSNHGNLGMAQQRVEEMLLFFNLFYFSIFFRQRKQKLKSPFKMWSEKGRFWLQVKLCSFSSLMRK